MEELRVIDKTLPKILNSLEIKTSMRINEIKGFNDLDVFFLFDNQKYLMLSNHFQEFDHELIELVGISQVMIREVQEVNTHLPEFDSLVPVFVHYFQENDQFIPVIVPLDQESVGVVQKFDSLSPAIIRGVQVSVSCFPMIDGTLPETVRWFRNQSEGFRRRTFKK